jgi:protein TonB
MSAVVTSAKVSASDRLIFTLFLSLALNAIVILGVGFDFFDPSKQESPLPTLEVILVDKNDSKAPEDADFLAQTDQSGKGNTRDKKTPRTMEAAQNLPVPVNGDSDVLRPEQTAEQVPTSQEEVLTRPDAPTQVYTLENPDKKQAKETTSAELIRRGQEIARLTAEIKQSFEVYSKQEKHRYISASTKSFRDAAYLDAWRRKIERVGNLNYPDQAKRRGLSGSLLMDVAINTNGTIRQITILRPSGHKVLDDAAQRIVRLAGPFAPLPPEMLKDTDVLHITRTWLFTSGNEFSTH